MRLQCWGFGLSKTPMNVTLLISIAAASVLLTSCNTMIGLGRDMRIGGESLESSVTKATGGSTSSESSGAPVY